MLVDQQRCPPLQINDRKKKKCGRRRSLTSRRRPDPLSPGRIHALSSQNLPAVASERIDPSTQNPSPVMRKWKKNAHRLGSELIEEDEERINGGVSSVSCSTERMKDKSDPWARGVTGGVNGCGPALLRRLGRGWRGGAYLEGRSREEEAGVEGRAEAAVVESRRREKTTVLVARRREEATNVVARRVETAMEGRRRRWREGGGGDGREEAVAVGRGGGRRRRPWCRGGGRRWRLWRGGVTRSRWQPGEKEEEVRSAARVSYFIVVDLLVGYVMS